ncbi:response regulator transcription factor [Nonomuraea ferruginea]
MGDAIRTVLADDHYLVREGTRQLLETSGGVTVVSAVGDADELLDAVRRLRPDVVVTDIRMPGGDWRQGFEGIDAAHAVRAAHPGGRHRGAVAVLRRAVRAGAVQARHRGLRLPAEGPGRRPGRAARRDQGGGLRGFGHRPEGSRGPDGETRPAR